MKLVWVVLACVLSHATLALGVPSQVSMFAKYDESMEGWDVVTTVVQNEVFELFILGDSDPRRPAADTPEAISKYMREHEFITLQDFVDELSEKIPANPNDALSLLNFQYYLGQDLRAKEFFVAKFALNFTRSSSIRTGAISWLFSAENPDAVVEVWSDNQIFNGIETRPIQDTLTYARVGSATLDWPKLTKPVLDIRGDWGDAKGSPKRDSLHNLLRRK